MKRLFFAVALAICLGANAQDEKGIHFEQSLSWEQIKSKAATENKYVFVDVFATWCGPCKMMEQTVYPNDTVSSLVNEKFISVKLQMDSGARDNEQVKSWYETAKEFGQAHMIPGYPSFFFFSPDGKLTYTDVGYRDVSGFVKLVNQALDPKSLLYYAEYEKYKRGEKNYNTMAGLAEFVQSIVRDNAMGLKIAMDYKVNYLDKLSSEQLVADTANFDFINKFQNLITVNDDFFQLCYIQPDKIDQLVQAQGFAKELVDQAITRDMIAAKVIKGDKGITKYPDWEKIQKDIAKKYKEVDSRHLVLNYKIAYYQNQFLDWQLWAQYRDEEIKAYPPKPPYGMSVYGNINGWGGAWLAFMKCNDTIVLKKAIEWVDLALRLEGENSTAYLDTKANLFYKLGRKDEAITLEKKAAILQLKTDNPGFDVFKITVNQMEKGEPTNLQDGAIWDSAARARIKIAVNEPSK
jgi:thiol-disulfide isomerase/thioredoxin